MVEDVQMDDLEGEIESHPPAVSGAGTMITIKTSEPCAFASMDEGERSPLEGANKPPLVLPSLTTLNLPKVPTPQFTTPDEEWVLISTDVGLDAVYRKYKMPSRSEKPSGEGATNT